MRRVFGLIAAVISKAEELFTPKRPLVIGHRGYCGVAPENTLPSFQLALEAGARAIELDYRHSKDGVPMVIHDPVLDRTTDARKRWRKRRIKVSQRAAAEIQTLDAGSWFNAKFAGAKVPRLDEALEFICGGGAITVIERKSGDPATLATLLSTRNLINKVIVISFDWKFLREFHALEPTQILGALGPPTRLSNGRKPVHMRRGLGARLKDLAKTGARIAVWNRKVSNGGIRAAHKHGLKVWVYTVDDGCLAQRLLRRGVNAIITNRITHIQKTLAKT